MTRPRPEYDFTTSDSEENDILDNNENVPGHKEDEDYRIAASSPTGKEWREDSNLRTDGGAAKSKEGVEVYSLQELVEDAWSFYRSGNMESEKVYADESNRHELTARDARVFLEEGFSKSYNQMPDEVCVPGSQRYNVDRLLEDSSAEEMENFLDEAVEEGYLEKQRRDINIEGHIVEHQKEAEEFNYSITFYKPVF